MKKVSIVAALMLVILSSAVFADKPLGPVEMTSVDELAYAIAAYFPKVHGEVTAVQGDRLTLSLGEKNGLLPGMVLSVWRDGKNILHPVTGAVIGRAEDEVGTIEVVSVKDTSSTTVMKKRIVEPKPGDRARITPKKINIAIIPLRSDQSDIVQGLAERLGDLGRFTVLGKDKVAAFLQDKTQRDDSLVKEMGSAFGLDAVLAVGIFPSEGKHIVTARIFSADDAKPIDTIVAQLNITSKREALGDVRPFFAPAKDLSKTPAAALVLGASGKMPDLPVEARYFVLADLDGDGTVEYVFSDEQRISIYRTETSGWAEVWKEPADKREREMQQFRVETADINGNGRPEIFVTRMMDGMVSSYAIEFANGSFQRTADIPGFLRVVRYPGRGSILIGQNYSRESFFAGTPSEYVWSGGAYVPGAPFALPKGVDLYSFVLADLGESRPLLVAFDNDRHLVVYADDTAIWRSEEKYPAVDTVLTKPLSGLGAAVATETTSLDKTFQPSAPLVEKDRLVRISGRILAIDLSGSGRDDIVVAKNAPAAILGGYKDGELAVLGWTGTRLEPRWSVKDLAGPVLDIQVTRTEKDGVQMNGLVKVSGGIFGKNKMRVEKYAGK